jgi:aminoglycoside phosphotransferase (APT) family kinase protein
VSAARLVDRPTAVRPGEELDVGRLRHYLQQSLGLAARELGVAQFPGGHSNLTYLITVDGDEYVLRRPPFGSQVRSAHDMGREYRVLRALAPLHPAAPRPLLHCDDDAVLGAPFYLMERRRGVILRKNPPAELSLAPARCRSLSLLLVDTLADLHAIDPGTPGLTELGRPAGYVARQVHGWSERYERARTDEIPEMRRVAEWLAAELPDSPPATLLHNDFKFDNLVLAAPDLDAVVAILDWEMATVGDPLMDLGTALAYWIQADDPPGLHALRFGPTHLPGMLSRQELASHYAERTGRDIGRLSFYYCFGLFKIAVVAQQIYFRYQQGLTRDPRFAGFLPGVRALATAAAAAIDRGRV